MNLTSKTQIDRLGDRLRKGNVGDEELQQLDEFRRSFAGAYEEVIAVVRRATKLEPTGRPAKSTTSIVEKLHRETMRLSQMQDIAGCRLVVHDIVKQNQVVEQLKETLLSATVMDRREQPSHGYRAVHIIATAQGKPVEIQVRTELQHLWAQLSEKTSDVFDPGIKYGGGDPDVFGAISKISERIETLETLELSIGRLERRSKRSPGLRRRWRRLAENFDRDKKRFRQGLERVIPMIEGPPEKQAGD